MLDEENTQPIQQVQSEPASEPTAPAENPISEPNPAPVSPDEPMEQTPIPPTESTFAEVPSVATEAPSSSEDPSAVKDPNLANEPFDKTQDKPPEPVLNEPNNPNITVEKRGNDVTITEIMKPEPEPKTETAQMTGNEPLDLAEEIKTKQRQENLKLANETRQEKKREKIDAILDLFAKQTNLSNDEVEKLLHVSDATATRYLETLEKEGKIKQVGKTGKSVNYIKI